MFQLSKQIAKKEKQCQTVIYLNSVWDDDRVISRQDVRIFFLRTPVCLLSVSVTDSYRIVSCCICFVRIFHVLLLMLRG